MCSVLDAGRYNSTSGAPGISHTNRRIHHGVDLSIFPQFAPWSAKSSNLNPYVPKLVFWLTNWIFQVCQSILAEEARKAGNQACCILRKIRDAVERIAGSFRDNDYQCDNASDRDTVIYGWRIRILDSRVINWGARLRNCQWPVPVWHALVRIHHLKCQMFRRISSIVT